jgi:hypothetical protein
MEEADGVGEGVLDEHALGIASDQLGRPGVAVVGEEESGLVVSQEVIKTTLITEPRAHIDKAQEEKDWGPG